MTAQAETEIAERVAAQIVERFCDAIDEAMGRNPLADKVLALADQYDGYGVSSLVGPHSVAVKLRALVREVRGG